MSLSPLQKPDLEFLGWSSCRFYAAATASDLSFPFRSLSPLSLDLVSRTSNLGFCCSCLLAYSYLVSSNLVFCPLASNTTGAVVLYSSLLCLIFHISRLYLVCRFFCPQLQMRHQDFSLILSSSPAVFYSICAMDRCFRCGSFGFFVVVWLFLQGIMFFIIGLFTVAGCS